MERQRPLPGSARRRHSPRPDGFPISRSQAFGSRLAATRLNVDRPQRRSSCPFGPPEVGSLLRRHQSWRGRYRPSPRTVPAASSMTARWRRLSPPAGRGRLVADWLTSAATRTREAPRRRSASSYHGYELLAPPAPSTQGVFDPRHHGRPWASLIGKPTEQEAPDEAIHLCVEAVKRAFLTRDSQWRTRTSPPTSRGIARDPDRLTATGTDHRSETGAPLATAVPDRRHCLLRRRRLPKGVARA